MISGRFSQRERAFNQYVIAHLKNFSTVIDVTRFVNAFRWDAQILMDMYLNALWSNPEIFFVGKTVRFEGDQYSDGTARYAKLTGIKYAFPKSEYRQNKQKLDAELKKAVACAATESAPEMIALRLHDYIIRECEYDTVAADKNDLSPLSRTAYSVLVRKKAVCEGYTMAYRYLLKKFNIPNEAIVSEEMNHCWNYVCIRGCWYHTDVTYDDPVFVGGGGGVLAAGETFLAKMVNGISRKHFLMSDEKARQTDHYGWTTKGLPPASAKTYDHKNWN